MRQVLQFMNVVPWFKKVAKILKKRVIAEMGRGKDAIVVDEDDIDKQIWRQKLL